jgi:hypothetical protein
MAKRQRGHALRQVCGTMPAPSAWACHPLEYPTRRFQNDSTLARYAQQSQLYR